MAPRNLAEPMYRALKALEEEKKLTVDEYAADQLGTDIPTLHKRYSAAQIDSLALELRNFERHTGLINTDEGGIGKGRTVSGALDFADQRGMIGVFVSAKKALYTDMAERDLKNVGRPDYVPLITDNNYYYVDGRGKEHKVTRRAADGNELFQQVARTGQLPKGMHGIFTTYSQLTKDKPAGFRETPGNKARRKRNNQALPDGPIWEMLRSLGPRVFLILDEAHLAAGPGSEANLRLRSLIPNVGGIYYSSATFAKRPDNLGLYAAGTSMRLSGLGPQEITDALTRGGVPLQQALSSMLAETGELMRRQHDISGTVWNFKATAKGEAAKREIQMADTYTKFIRDLRSLAKLINSATASMVDDENQVRPDESKVDVEPITFGSRLFNLSNQYLLALRAEATVQEALLQLKEGRKPFIAIYNTMERPITDLRARGLPLSFAGILRREMAKMLHVVVQDPLADGGKREVDLQPEDLPDGGTFYHQMENEIGVADFSSMPISPIDYIKEKLQAATVNGRKVRVGEVTARSEEVSSEGGEEVVVTRKERGQSVQTFKAYNNGDLDAMIVNGCGSTGVSAHTDPEYKDQRQRTFICAQAAPDINEFMQMTYRVFRFGQTSKPVYTVLTTALAAERRFATMLRGKLTSLNANSTADTESQMTQNQSFAADVFNEVGDDVVWRVLKNHWDLGGMLGLNLLLGEQPDNAARYCTGRFVLLPNADAQGLWDEIISDFNEEISLLDEAGQNPLKATAEDLRARTLESTELVAGTGNTPFDGPAMLERATVTPPKQPMKHEEAMALATKNRGVWRDKVTEWIDKSRQFEQEHLSWFHDLTPDEADGIRANYERVRQLVATAYHNLAETFGVDLVGQGEAAFYGVGMDLKLKADKASDVRSASRQQIILGTNTYKRKLTLPLSKMEKDDGTSMLLPVDEDDAAQQFDSTAETNTERYFVTGNLLRGIESASSAVAGQGIGQPRVAIYTRADGSVVTGILMPPSWAPGTNQGGGGGPRPVANRDEFAQNIPNDVPMRSTPLSGVHPITIEHGVMTLPSTGAGRSIWGDPRFRNWVSNAVQHVSTFRGDIIGRNLEGFFDFLREKGVRLVTMPGSSTTADFQGGGEKPYASRGLFTKGTPVLKGGVPMQLGGMQHVRPVEMPELVRLAKALVNGGIKLKRPGRKALGQFAASGSDALIHIDPKLFRDSIEAAKVLTHEVGHAADWLDDETLTRGNLLGHLNALRRFMRGSLGAVNNADIKKELLALTMYWRPYDPLKDPKSYVKYRETPEELYADALSVLLNSPGLLEQKAPKFYKAFFEALKARPGVKAELVALWELLDDGAVGVLTKRGELLREMFGKGEDILKAKWAARDARAKSFEGYWSNFKQVMYWRFAPIASQFPDMVPMLEAHALSDNINARFVRMMFEKVLLPVEGKGMTEDDLGLFLFLTRVAAGDMDAARAAGKDPDTVAALGRAGLANPGGMTAWTAKMGLLKMNLDLGMARMQVLRDSVQRFHELVFDRSKEAVSVGAYNQTAFKTVIEPNKNNYAAFGVLDYLEAYVPAGLRRQKGTLKDIANPFQITVLKMIALNNLIAIQKVKNATRSHLLTHFPDEIERAAQPVIGKGLGGGIIRAEPKARTGKGLLMILENGKPAFYYVDPYIAKAFEKAGPDQLTKALRVLDFVYRKFMYPLQISYSVGFQFFTNPARDFWRTWRNMPKDVGRFRQLPTLIANYRATFRDALARVAGRRSDLHEEMLANAAVGIPFEALGGQLREDFMGEVLKRYRMAPNSEKDKVWDSLIMAPVRKFTRAVQYMGAVLESWPKFAGYRMLRRVNQQPDETAYHVRNYVGTPNIYKKGTGVMAIRAAVPFYNVFLQGMVSDLQRMKPGSGSGWWFKWAMTDGLLAVITGLIGAGVFGAALKELYDRVSEYNKSTYNVIPIGVKAGGDFGYRTVFLRLPRAEDSRLVSGLVYKLTRKLAGESPGQWGSLLEFGGGQFPSVNPALTIPYTWGQAAMGLNPTDSFRGNTIIPEREYSAGGMAELGPLFHWTLSESGYNNFVAWNPHAESTLELAFSAIPGLNRMIVVSDYGKREQQRADKTSQQSDRDKVFLSLPNQVQSLVSEHERLESLGRARTMPQTMRFVEVHDWYTNSYKPLWENIRTRAESGKDTARERTYLGRTAAPFKR